MSHFGSTFPTGSSQPTAPTTTSHLLPPLPRKPAGPKRRPPTRLTFGETRSESTYLGFIKSETPDIERCFVGACKSQLFKETVKATHDNGSKENSVITIKYHPTDDVWGAKFDHTTRTILLKSSEKTDEQHIDSIVFEYCNAENAKRFEELNKDLAAIDVLYYVLDSKRQSEIAKDFAQRMEVIEYDSMLKAVKICQQLIDSGVIKVNTYKECPLPEHLENMRRCRHTHLYIEKILEILMNKERKLKATLSNAKIQKAKKEWEQQRSLAMKEKELKQEKELKEEKIEKRNPSSSGTGDKT